MSIEFRIFPGDENIQFVCNPIKVEDISGDYTLSNPCDNKRSDNRLSGSFIYDGISYSSERESDFHKFSLIENTDILSGDTFVGDINAVIDSSILGASEYQGIFVESSADYTFESSKKITTAIRSSPVIYIKYNIIIIYEYKDYLSICYSNFIIRLHRRYRC